MRLPDLSGLSLAPTGSRATPCDWRFDNCVTFYLADDLFARHADLVRELGLTQESCKVMLSAVEGDKARVVSPYETLYGSAWWNMLLIELGMDELQVLLSYYKPSKNVWRAFPVDKKWSEVNPKIRSPKVPSKWYTKLRLRPLPSDDHELVRRVLVAMHVVNQGVKAMDAADTRKRYPYLGASRPSHVPKYGEKPAPRKRPGEADPPAKRVRLAREAAEKKRSDLQIHEAMEAEFAALEEEEEEDGDKDEDKEGAAKAAFEEYLRAVGKGGPEAMDEAELPEPSELGWTVEELRDMVREEADSDTE
jgi:hypothetical protein